MTSRRIVLDANILIRAVLGVKVGGLIAKYANAIEFCAPSIAFEDADAHLPDIMAKRGIRAAELSLGLDAVRLVVEEVPAEATEPMLPDLDRGQGLLRFGRAANALSRISTRGGHGRRRSPRPAPVR